MRIGYRVLGTLIVASLLFVDRDATGQTRPTTTNAATSTATSTTPATATTQPAARPLPSAAVRLRGKKLFEVHHGLGAWTATERSEAIGRRLDELASQPFGGTPRFSTSDHEEATDVVAGSRVVMSVTNRDARTSGLPRVELARRLAILMQRAVLDAREAFRGTTLLLDLLFAVLTTVVFYFLVKGLNRIVKRLVRRLHAIGLPAIRIQQVEIISRMRVAGIVITAIRLARTVAVVIGFAIYLTLVFRYFPWTREFSNRVVTLVLTPVRTGWAALVSYLPSFAFLLVIGVVVWYGLKAIHFVFREIGKGTLVIPDFDAEWAEPTYKIARFLVIAFATVVAFPYLPGSESPAFKGVTIFLGVLFSLGSTSAVANVVSGVVLTYTRSFREGDRVSIGETTGDVLEKKTLVTRLLTIKNEEVTIPNSVVMAAQVKNYSAAVAEHGGLILHTTVTIGYDAPWPKVHELLIAAASATEGIIPTPAPFVLQTSLDDFFVSYEINAYTREPQRMVAIYSELHRRIQDAFNEAGMEIMSPHYSALRDGNEIAIPRQYRDASHRAPAFRIKSDEG